VPECSELTAHLHDEPELKLLDAGPGISSSL
jgi:hypothetical protein